MFVRIRNLREDADLTQENIENLLKVFKNKSRADGDNLVILNESDRPLNYDNTIEI